MFRISGKRGTKIVVGIPRPVPVHVGAIGIEVAMVHEVAVSRPRFAYRHLGQLPFATYRYVGSGVYWYERTPFSCIYLRKATDEQCVWGAMCVDIATVPTLVYHDVALERYRTTELIHFRSAAFYVKHINHLLAGN